MSPNLASKMKTIADRIKGIKMVYMGYFVNKRELFKCNRKNWGLALDSVDALVLKSLQYLSVLKCKFYHQSIMVRGTGREKMAIEKTV